jgi:hypothetical protein
VYHHITIDRICNVPNPVFEMLLRDAQILEQGGNFICPGIWTDIDPEDLMPLAQQA